MPRYIIKASRYLDGGFVYASPDAPAEIELPEGTKVDRGLTPVGSPEAAAEPLKPHYVTKEAKQAAQAAQSEVGGKKGRPSDRDVA
jgi:hypothetical protein